MKSLEELRAIRERMQSQVSMRAEDHTHTRVVVGMATCGMVGPIGVYAGWVNDVATGAKAAITSLDWVGLALICFVLPAVLCWLFGLFFRRIGWIKEGDLTLE